MNWKDKIKTFTIGALTTFLTSCGFGGENKEKDYVTSWEETPEKIVPVPETETSADNKISPDKILNTMAGEISKTRWKNLSRGEADPIADTEIIKEFLKMYNIPYEKGDSVLRSAEWVYETESNMKEGHVIGSKLINPIYEKAQKTRKTNVEEHDGVTIRRKEHKEIPQEIKVITLSKVENPIIKEEHFEKVKKMVEDKKLEQGLHKGDTVENEKLLPSKDGSKWDFEIKKEQAVVQKDGVSPTYKDYDKTKTQYIMKLKFDYTYGDQK